MLNFMQRAARKPAGRMLHRVSVTRGLSVALAGVLGLTTTASVFAANNPSLAIAAIRAFDRNHNQRLETSEYRALRIRMHDVFDGDTVSSTVILRASPEFQAIYSAADRDRSVSLSSAESRDAAAVLSALSPAPNRRVAGRLPRSQSSRTQRQTITNSGSLAGLPRQLGPGLAARGLSGTIGTGQASSFSRPMIGSIAQDSLQGDLRAAQLRFEAMRARMELEAELRRRGVQIADDLPSPLNQTPTPSSREDSRSRNDANESDSGSSSAGAQSSSAGAQSSHNDDSNSGTAPDGDADSDDNRTVASGGSGSSGTGTSGGGSGSSGSDSPDNSSSSGGNNTSGSSGGSGGNEQNEGHHEGNHGEHEGHHEGHDGDGDD